MISISQLVYAVSPSAPLTFISDHRRRCSADTIFEGFCTEQEVADIRHAFNTEVPITQMAAIGTETGLTLRAHNLLAKTRACAA